MKHTPGPWKIETYHDSMFKISREYDPAIGVASRLKADARLIAAAPDLLKALLDVRSYLIKNRDAVPRSAPAVVKAMIQIQIDKCDQAIATAVGVL